jgi:gamma-glutamylcyclotransferase
MRINPDGSETGQVVPCMTYVDFQRQDEGEIMPDYIIWINKAIKEGKPLGLPDDYVQKYIRPYIPADYDERDEQEIQMVRVMSPRGQQTVAPPDKSIYPELGEARN